MQTYDASAVARLEKLYGSPQIADQRRRLRAVIAARPGEKGLDIGCGVVYLACELAREVAPGGHIAAIDSSHDSVDASRKRIAAQGLGDSVRVGVGDAGALDFADATFDFAVVAQVYCYVRDVAGAIREAARVLRPGGRLVILDSDWDMCIWASGDRALTRRLIDARAQVQFAHAHLPRDLHRLIHAAGMTLSDLQAYPIIETRYDPDSYSAGLIDQTVKAGVRQGMPAEGVAAWEKDLRSRTDQGDWFFCLNRFIFTATR
jgi:arsenite methyltransferase